MFKKGDIVVCVNDEGIRSLVKGQVCTVFVAIGDRVMVTIPGGKKGVYFSTRFQPASMENV